MGLNTIAAVLEKKGQSYVDKFLDENLVITEKLDTLRILFEYSDGTLQFFKKDNTPITLIERTLNDVWEPAILEIPTLINETKLPEGIRFGVAYTPVERPLRIPYTNLPRYILTDMSKRKNGKVIESYDYDEVTHWAGMLCMARPPILFEGVLTNEQKKILVDYDTRNYKGSGETFTQMIEETLGTTYSKSDIMEGIVIKSNKNLSQIISYEFDLLNEAYKNTSKSRDFYDIVLLSINEFMDSYKFSKVEHGNVDEMYIDVISDMFVEYCKTDKLSEGLEPEYLTAPQYGHIGKLNKKFIKNESALSYIKLDPIYEALYRVFVSSFRKHKKPYGLLSESVVDKFNSYVGLIKNIINDDTNTLNENISDNIVINTLNNRQTSDVNNMKVIASVQNAFNPPEYNIQQGKQRVVVYLTSFQPFTSAQMTNVQQIHSKWNVPVILCSVSKDNNITGGNFHLSDNLVKSQMQALSNFNKSIIPSYMVIGNWDLKEIFEYCRPDYEPLLVITDSGKKSEIGIQLYYEEQIMGGKIGVLPEFNIGEMENNELIVAARSIEDGNGSAFMELTPKSIHNFYDNIANEYRIWEGSILPQFEPTIYTEIK